MRKAPLAVRSDAEARALVARERALLASIKTLPDARQAWWRAKALTAALTAARRHYGISRETADDAVVYRLDLERLLAQLVAEGQRRGEIHDVGRPEKLTDSLSISEATGLAPQSFAPIADLGRLSEAAYRTAITKAREAGDLSRTAVLVAHARQSPAPPGRPVPDPPEGEYRCIVVDPPWPMQKIERDLHPIRDATREYGTMAFDDLRALPLPAAADCHLYLWTTHRFFPAALELAEAWGFRYQCVLTWIKNVGFTPYSWMYSTEHALFARRGSLDLLVQGRRLDFSAKRREHSRKPDEFYDLVRDVSPGPRLDMFSREARAGFDQWGNEPDRFRHDS
jgi:N6-adenosine-specific RNA methylase IME4